MIFYLQNQDSKLTHLEPYYLLLAERKIKNQTAPTGIHWPVMEGAGQKGTKQQPARSMLEGYKQQGQKLFTVAL